jgi:hypothetical protein
VVGPIIASLFGSGLAAAIGFVLSFAAMGLAVYFGFVRAQWALQDADHGTDWHVVGIVAAVFLALGGLLVFFLVRAG